MSRKLANIAANMRANFFYAVRRCQTLSDAVRRVTRCQALSGDVRRVTRCQTLSDAVRRCQARYALSGDVRHKKTAHDSAARIGNKKAALSGLISFYRVKCNVTKTASPASFMMRSIVSASIIAPLFRAPSAILQNLLFPIRAGKRTADCVNSLAIN